MSSKVPVGPLVCLICYIANCFNFFHFKVVLRVEMHLAILTTGVKNPWLINLPCIRKARYWYIFRAKILLWLRQSKHLHPFNVLCLWFICPSLFLRLLEGNHLTLKIPVGYIILISKLMLRFLNLEWTIFVHDAIWTLLGSFSDITSVEGDEEITWSSENNKPILRVLLVFFFSPMRGAA